MALDGKVEFRLGTTSFILPDDILPNVRYLAGRVQDVELVLFEVDDGPNNLPDETTLSALHDLAIQAGLTYTVHLPLDLRLGDGGDEGHVSMQKAKRVIDCTRGLDPAVYVVHLDGRAVRQGASREALRKWTSQAIRSLEIAAGWAGSAERLAVENLETYPLDFLEPVLARAPVSCCVDIGHLWVDGHDPVAYLRRVIDRTRVVHLHGIGERDHQSLRLTSPEALDRAVHFLAAQRYGGVLTLEVFSEADLTTSIEALAASLDRYHDLNEKKENHHRERKEDLWVNI